MVQLKTMLTSADNSGARRLMCIQVMGGYKKDTAGSAISLPA